MWRLHRYYLKELAVNAAITFGVLFAVVLVSVVYRGIQRSEGSSNPFDAVKIIFYFAFDAVPHLLTISFLIATVLTYTRAAQDRELVAIRAAGLAPRVPMLPALLIGLFLSVGASFANHYVAPSVHFMKYRVVKEMLRSLVMGMNLNGDRVSLFNTGYVMTYASRESDEIYHDCTVYAPKPIAGFKSSILFVETVWIQLGSGDDAFVEVPVQLRGVREPGGTAVSAINLVVSPEGFVSPGGRLDGDADLRSDQLLGEVLRGVHQHPAAAIYTLFRRCCFSLMPALMAPIGYCIAELARERGRVVALLLLLVPLGLFYLGEVLGARLMLTTDNPLCGWMPALLLALFGVPLLWKELRR